MKFNKGAFQNIIYIALAIGSFYTVAFLVLSKNNLVINWTPSHVPVGLYQIDSLPKSSSAIGDIVLFSIDELYRVYPELTDAQSKTVSRTFIKIVGAVAGDHISKIDNKVAVNGRTLNNAVINSNYENGEPRCKIHYPLTVPNGHVWLITDTEFSFDSRYYGPVPEKIIYARVKEFWTWD